MTVTNIPPASEPQPAVPSGRDEKLPVSPAYASWFQEDSIHDIEQRAFPELAGEARLEPLYRDVRNFMVSAYRTRPDEYLSLTACRRHLPGDVAFLAKVHAFLEQWGLINYRQSISLPTVPLADIKDHRLAAACAPSLSVYELAGLHGKECRMCKAQIPEHASFYVPIERNAADTVALSCANCFANGNLPTGRQPGDYIQVPGGIADAKDPSWSEEETLRLLEAIEGLSLQTDQEEGLCDWDAVAEKMNRRKEECVWQFLRLPMPKDVIEPQSSAEAASASVLSSIPSADVPFAFARSPTMALLTFLAANVHPKVASHAAKSALEQLASTKENDQSLTEQWMASTALALAADKARTLASEESARIGQLHDHLLALQLRKLQQKMTQLEALSKGIDDERKSVEAQRLAIFYERCKLMAKLKEKQ